MGRMLYRGRDISHGLACSAYETCAQSVPLAERQAGEAIHGQGSDRNRRLKDGPSIAHIIQQHLSLGPWHHVSSLSALYDTNFAVYFQRETRSRVSIQKSPAVFLQQLTLADPFHSSKTLKDLH